MAQGRINIVVSVEIDTGDDTPMEAMVGAIAEETNVVLSKEVVMIESRFPLYSPQIEEVEVA